MNMDYKEKMLDGKKDLLSLTFTELEDFIVKDLVQPKFRAKQIWEWLWKKNATSFEEMTSLSKDFRTLLIEKAIIIKLELVKMQESKDGTIKFLLSLHDNETIETVLIPSTDREGKRRITQCISCQVGCAMACSFCSTGTMGFTRNMTIGEILGQIQFARTYLDDIDPSHPLIRNIVFMGMGEPLLNLDNVIGSLEGLNNTNGLAFSPRRITVSTCGIKKGLQELSDCGLCYLAVSLHAPYQDLREKLMPKAAKAWHLEDFIKELGSYKLKNREWITLEYLLIGGLNDSIEEAKELVKICSHLKAKLNLIPYKSTPHSEYKSPKQEKLRAFQEYLNSKGIVAVFRKSKGSDIAAACGQLKSS